MADLIQLRRDTAANWTSVDPILAQGEMGIELVTDKFKIGNGVDVWSALAYASSGGGGVGDVVGPASATANHIVTFDGTTGKIIKDSGLTSASFDPAGAAAAITPTTLGLVIGTNVQAFDADLTTWAGVTPGTGITTALAVAVGTDGAPVIKGGALGSPSSAGVIPFTPQVAPVYAEGKVFYDSSANTLCYYNDNSQMTVNVGQEQIVKVRNTTGSPIGDGVVVYVSGATGQTPLVTPAIATSFAASDIIGVTTTTIAHNAFGYVTINGTVNGIDTSAFADGACVYLSATVAGALSTVSPDAPNYCTQVGIILHSHATQGKLLVAPQLLSAEAAHIIGLGSAALTSSSAYATASQGAKADAAVVANVAITGATKTKITYDAKGLVTSGADATTADVADSSNKRYVTDAQLTVLGNTSGTNTGDSASVPIAQNTLTKDPTGFTAPDSVVSTYDSTTRTVTLTGSVEAHWNGTTVTALVSGWTSAAHTATTGGWFLYYNGSSFVWSQTPWTFDMLQIAYVYYGTTDRFGIKETHGLMPWQVHEEFHQTVGTYLISGGDMAGYTLASTTAANRRPTITSTLVQDEDLETTNAALTSSLYTQMYLSGAGATPTWVVDAADIVPLLANNPYYNFFTSGAWTQTLLPNNAYMAVWLVAIPTMASVTGQKYRYQWIQGQSQSATLATIQAQTPSSLNLAGLTGVSTEWVFIGRVIIRYAASNWTFIQVDKLLGNKSSTTTSPAGTYLSSVTTDTNFTGDGTAVNPLALSTTPALGTPASVTLTNGTGLPIGSGVSGLGTGVATALAVNVGSAGAPVVNGGVGNFSTVTSNSTLATQSAPLGSELLSTSNWTSTGWTGDFNAGFTHTAGNTTALTNTLAAVTNNLYQITYTVTGRTAGTFVIGFGGETWTGLSATGAWGPKALSTGTLSITPTTDFNGTIVLSIKQITGTFAATEVIKDSAGNNTVEIRNTAVSLVNTFVGLNSGRYNTTGNNNIGFGVQSLYSNTTGNGNSALGVQALYSNTTGSYNAAVGGSSLFFNTTGSSNSAFGISALQSNTTGNSNAAVGVQSLYSNTTGNGNAAAGVQSLFFNTTGYNNAAVGIYALQSNTTGYYLTAIGRNAGRYITGGATGNTVSNTSTYLGAETKAYADGDTNETVIGYNATGAGSNTTTIGNTSVTSTVINGVISSPSTATINTTGTAGGLTGTPNISVGTVSATKATAGDVATFTNAAASNKTAYIYSDNTYIGFSSAASVAAGDKLLISVGNWSGVYGTSNVYQNVGGSTITNASSTGLAVTGTLSANGLATYGNIALRVGNDGAGAYPSVGYNWIGAGTNTYNYVSSDSSSKIMFYAGGVRIETAAAGTAGNPISFTTRCEFTQTGAQITGTLSSTVSVNLPSYTVATVPSAATAGATIYVSNAGGNGPCIAMSNGSVWKRCDNTSTTVS